MVQDETKSTRERVVEYIQSSQQDFYRLAYSYTHNRDAALDVVQEAVVKAISKSNTLRKPEYLKTWFYRILINEAISSLRKNRYTPEDFDSEEIPVEDKDAAEAADLYNAVQRLEPQLRTIVILRFYEDMKLEEVAGTLHTNLSTVKSRLYRALQLLRIEISEEKL